MSGIVNKFSEERSLHPLTLVYNGIKSSPPLLISLYLAFVQNDKSEWMYSIILIILFFGILPSIILNFIYFKFKITDKEIYIQSGIIAKKNRVIPISKVQNVNFSQNFFQKLLGISRVQIETAGDISAEGVLEFVSVANADEISKIIKYYQSNVDVLGINPTLIEKEHRIDSADGKLFSMNLKDIFIYGALRFRPVFLFFGFWLYSFLQQFSFFNLYFEDVFTSNMKNLQDLNVFYLTLLVTLSIIAIFFISWILDIIWTINTFYGFNLINEKNKLITSGGLLSKQTQTIPFKKIQQISIVTNFLKEHLDYYSLRFYTAGFGLKAKGNDIAVPNAKLQLIYEVIDKIKQYRIPKYFLSISKKSIKRVFIRYLVLLIIFSIVLQYFSVYFWFLLLFSPFLYYFAFLNWKFRGYLFIDNTLYIKYGVIIRKINIIPIKKFQTLKIRETFFQRRLGLATLILDTAAVTLSAETLIRYIDIDVAEKLFDEISENFNKQFNSAE